MLSYIANIMDIPEKYYEQFPELEDIFIEVSSTIKALKSCRIDKLYPNQTGKSLTPLTVFRFEVYLQVVLYRIIELSESIITCLSNSNTTSAFILLRALNENSSIIFDAYLRLTELIKENDFQKVHELIYNLQYGMRLKNKIKKLSKEQSEKENNSYYNKDKIKEMYTSQQILNVMDRISKKIPNHRDIYEYLCEYTHPNYDGLMGLYCQWEDQFTVNLSKESTLNKKNINRIFSAFHAFLKMFVESYDSIVLCFPEITRLSIEEMKSRGEDTSSYENPI